MQSDFRGSRQKWEADKNGKLTYQLMGFIDYHLKNFNSIQWKDSNRARQLLQQGKEIAATNPSESTLHPIVRSVIDLMIEPPVGGPGVSF